MQVLPAIDIKDGAVVRLYKGDFAQITVFSHDPVETARGWETQGAALLHVVDLDGTESGSSRNLPVVAAVAEALTIPVQMGGGLRDLAAIEQADAAGVARIVLGTVALEQPELVAEACARYPGRVVVALDARNGKVMTHGWQQESGVDMFDLAHQMVASGVSRFLYTDVERDGTLSQPNFEATGALAQAVSVPVIASGGVASLEHLARLATLGVEGAIVGSALYLGAFTLPEALETVRNTAQ
jgi:phosphoribosylformimino-5-aminoimidazole carboxamide ribotide isomerase